MTILPIHPPPLEDELLSSWLVRLAQANFQKVHVFMRLIYPNIPAAKSHHSDRHSPSTTVWYRDIDRSAKSDLLNVLAERTGLPLARVMQTTLRAYEGFLYQKHSDKTGASNWVMPLGVRSSKHTLFGLQCCPECLADTAGSYFRRSWRLALMTVCVKHRCFLIDRCPQCQAPIAFHRVDMGKDRSLPALSVLSICHRCEFDLRTFKAAPLDARASEQLLHVMGLQNWLTQGLNSGMFDLAELGASDFRQIFEGRLIHSGVPQLVSSIEVFTGIHELLRFLLSPNRGQRFFEAIQNAALVNGVDLSYKSPKSFEFKPLETRFQAMLALGYLLGEFPHRLMRHLTEQRLSISYVWHKEILIPMWIYVPLRGVRLD